MTIRNYQPQDCNEIYNLFYNTVHNINNKDYNIEQLNAWAPIDHQYQWCQSLIDNYTIVIDSLDKDKMKKIIAFGDITKEGYLNRLYVHHDHNGKGIGTLLANELEAYATSLGLSEITTHASITAKPFFKKRGYHLIKEQTVQRNGQQLTNYIMKKIIHSNK